MNTTGKKLGIGSQILLAHFDRCKKRGEKPTPKMLLDAGRFGLDLAAYGHGWAIGR